MKKKTSKDTLYERVRVDTWNSRIVYCLRKSGKPSLRFPCARIRTPQHGITVDVMDGNKESSTSRDKDRVDVVAIESLN